MFRLTGFGWWPFLGFFLFALPFAVGHFGFGCHKTDPGATTDPGTATENQTDAQALSAPAPSAGTPGPMTLLIPVGGAVLVGSFLRARRAQ